MSANVFCITPSSFQKEMLMTSAAPLRFIYSVFFFSPFSPSFSPSLLVLCANAFERISVSCDNSRIWTGRLLPAIVSTGRLPLSVIKEKKDSDNCIELDSCAIYFFIWTEKCLPWCIFVHIWVTWDSVSGTRQTRLGAANVVNEGVDQLFIPACFDTSHSRMTPGVSTFTSFVVKRCALTLILMETQSVALAFF